VLNSSPAAFLAFIPLYKFCKPMLTFNIGEQA
jgi:hypothetical protein